MIRIVIVCLLALLAENMSAQFSVPSGNTVFDYTSNLSGPDIKHIYVFNKLTGATLTYSTNSSNVVAFYKYTGSLSDKQPIPTSDITWTNSNNQTIYTIKNLEDGKGYIAETNGNTTEIVGIIDYSLHIPQLNSIEVSEGEDKCSSIKLQINKNDNLYFNTPAGKILQITRLYDLEYETLDASTKEFTPITNKIESIAIGSDLPVDAPLTDTKFTISGDQFAKHFGQAIKLESNTYTAIAVKGYIETEQTSVNTDNEVSDELGGSAPAEIKFYGYANEPATLYYTWFIYNLKNPNDLVARYTDKNISYTFRESGEYKIILEVANRSSSCPDTTSVNFSIDESKLEIPNYFSPGQNGETIKEFRVYYKSLVKFKCSIFNRWGNKIYEWTDPSKGWDGKYKGSYVSTGVYFYVITAEGSDGKKYKKGGDINVLRSK